MKDDVRFKVASVSSIRKEDLYGGFCVRLDAFYDVIVTPLSIDVSTGDVMTPGAVPYEFGSIFDETVCISLFGYNIETIMAEKMETILNRGTLSTRPRDYYDIYILASTQKYDKFLFWKALKATSEHRGSDGYIKKHEPIIQRLIESKDLRQQWLKYQRKFSYAEGVSYDAIMEVIKMIMDKQGSVGAGD